MSLRTRLIISYIVIVVVGLALAFVTLILVARPIQNRLLQVRLAAQSTLAANRINTLYRQGNSTKNILARLEAWGDLSENRLLLIDPQGRVLTDSQGIWQGEQFRLETGDGQKRTAGVVGTPDGSRLVYVTTPVGSGQHPVGYVAAVAPRPAVLPGLLAELGWGFVVAGVVALLLSMLLGIVIARSIARPLQQIATGAGAVAAGDYEHRLPSPDWGPPEIKRVADSFNVMVARVENSQQAMRDFVSNVSHELKTPLTSIQGFAQAIVEGATPDDAARRKAAGIIYQEASRMVRMVEDLLDLARIDSGQVVMQKTALDLAQILTNTVERLLPQAAQKQVKLVKQWDTLPAIVGDGDRLAQVFTNFLDNAIRHTPAGGQVTLTAKTVTNLLRPQPVRPGLVQPDATTAISKRGQFLEISIADTGPGIPPADLARIFERFYQVDKSRKRGAGTGLGLAIAKEIVEAHGGWVRVESVEGIGTRFTVLLPLIDSENTVISGQ
jgi:signal transduction histidine kinase